MPRKLIGLRLEPSVYGRFKKLCGGERLGMGHAVQRLMEIALDAGGVERLSDASVVINKRRADTSKLTLARLLVELEGELLAQRIRDQQNQVLSYTARNVAEEIIAVLPQVDDMRLIMRAKRLVMETARFYSRMTRKEALGRPRL